MKKLSRIFGTVACLSLAAVLAVGCSTTENNGSGNGNGNGDGNGDGDGNGNGDNTTEVHLVKSVTEIEYIDDEQIGAPYVYTLTYDSDGRITTMTRVEGSYNTGYSLEYTDEKVTAQRTDSDNKIIYNLDANGYVTSQEYTAGIEGEEEIEVYSYNSSKQLTSRLLTYEYNGVTLEYGSKNIVWTGGNMVSFNMMDRGEDEDYEPFQSNIHIMMTYESSLDNNYSVDFNNYLLPISDDTAMLPWFPGTKSAKLLKKATAVVDDETQQFTVSYTTDSQGRVKTIEYNSVAEQYDSETGEYDLSPSMIIATVEYVD